MDRQEGRAGFTLIELLIVVAVLALLAAILIPVIQLVQHQSRQLRCSNNLQQIAAAIEVYRKENLDASPARLWRDPTMPAPGATLVTDDLFHNGGPLTGLTQVLLCPFDYANGQQTLMNRPTAWTDLSSIYTPNSSYEYDLSDVALDATTVTWFFSAQDPGGIPAAATWATGKLNQLTHGNRSDTSMPPTAFPPSQFPIIRCYWHYRWVGADTLYGGVKQVNNVSWNLNIFWSSPYWENDVNPAMAVQ